MKATKSANHSAPVIAKLAIAVLSAAVLWFKISHRRNIKIASILFSGKNCLWHMCYSHGKERFQAAVKRKLNKQLLTKNALIER